MSNFNFYKHPITTRFDLYDRTSRCYKARVFYCGEKVFVLTSEQAGRRRVNRLFLEFPTEKDFLAWRFKGPGQLLSDKPMTEEDNTETESVKAFLKSVVDPSEK